MAVTPAYTFATKQSLFGTGGYLISRKSDYTWDGCIDTERGSSDNRVYTWRYTYVGLLVDQGGTYSFTWNGTTRTATQLSDLLLYLCEDCAYVQFQFEYSGYYLEGFLESVTLEQSFDQSGGVTLGYNKYLATIVLVRWSPDENYANGRYDLLPSTQGYPQEIHISYSIGSPSVAIVTTPRTTPFGGAGETIVADGIKTITYGSNIIFRGQVREYSEWSQKITRYDKTTETLKTESIPYIRMVIYDGMEIISRSYIPSPRYFPASNSDYTAPSTVPSAYCSVQQVIQALFSACLIPRSRTSGATQPEFLTPSGLSYTLPSTLYFYTLEGGTGIFSVAVGAPERLADVIARFTQAGIGWLYCIPDPLANTSSGDFGIRYIFGPLWDTNNGQVPVNNTWVNKGRGWDTRNRLMHLIVYGGADVQFYEAQQRAYPISVVSFPTLSSSQVQTAGNTIWANGCNPIYYRIVRGSLAAGCVIPQLVSDVLSMDLHYKSVLLSPNQAGQPIKLDYGTPVLDEIELKLRISQTEYTNNPV